MKNPLALAIAIGMAALASSASPAAAEEAAPDPRTPAARFIIGLMPTRIHFGPELGVSASRLTASTEYRALLTPTEARRNYNPSPSFGANATFRWHHGFSLTVAPRYETYGVETREETVSFQDNPFPHTLKARTEMSYMVLPILAGMGWEGRNRHFRVQLGIYKANLDEGSVDWTVDGENYENHPQTEFLSDHGGWMFATEYGERLGAGELVLGFEAQQALGTMLEGLEGEVRSRGARVKLGYLWSVRDAK